MQPAARTLPALPLQWAQWYEEKLAEDKSYKWSNNTTRQINPPTGRDGEKDPLWIIFVDCSAILGIQKGSFAIGDNAGN